MIEYLIVPFLSGALSTLALTAALYYLYNAATNYREPWFEVYVDGVKVRLTEKMEKMLPKMMIGDIMWYNNTWIELDYRAFKVDQIVYNFHSR